MLSSHANSFEGDVVSNSTHTAMSYNVLEMMSGDSVISILMVSSFSLSEYIQGSFSCVGIVGNPLEEQVASADTPPITSRCKQAYLSIFGFSHYFCPIAQSEIIHTICPISLLLCSMIVRKPEFLCHSGSVSILL